MNTVQKFKQGRKIMKFQYGQAVASDNGYLANLVGRLTRKVAEPVVKTARHYYNMAFPFIPQLSVMPAIVNKTVDTIYPKSKSSQKQKSNKTSSKKEESSSSPKQEVKNKKVVEVPESILMTELSPEQLKVDLSTANRTPAISQKESTPTTVTASPVVSQEVIPVKSTNEVVQSNYINPREIFTREQIRAQRPLYSNVDELYDFINTYKDSREGQLIRNALGNNFTYYQFKDLMDSYGIRGNLGRRDSRRLADYLNSLSYKNGGLLSKNPIQRFKLKRGGKFFKY